MFVKEASPLSVNFVRIGVNDVTDAGGRRGSLAILLEAVPKMSWILRCLASTEAHASRIQKN